MVSERQISKKVEFLMIFVAFFLTCFWHFFSICCRPFVKWKLVTRWPIFNPTGLRICQNVALGLGDVFPKFLARISLKILRKSRFFMFALRTFLCVFPRIPIQTAGPHIWAGNPRTAPRSDNWALESSQKITRKVLPSCQWNGVY